jgi:hypothetical protein
MPVKLNPLKDLLVLAHQIPAHGLTPNTSIMNKPLLIYKSAFASDVTAGEIESHLASVGVVKPAWGYTMYSRSHFHVSLSHQAHDTLQYLAGVVDRSDICRQHRTKSWVYHTARPGYASGTRIILDGWRRLLGRVMLLLSPRVLRTDCWKMSRVVSRWLGVILGVVVGIWRMGRRARRRGLRGLGG